MDDITKLPLPAAAKRYARRRGLKAMMRQPGQFQRVNAMLTNPGKPDKFKEYTATPNVPHAIKDNQARKIVDRLIG